MTESIKSAIEKYLKVMSKKIDIDITLQFFYDEPYIVFVVDQKRMDKNTPEYDENYRNKIISKPPQNVEFHIPNPLGKVDRFVREMKQLFQIDDNIKSAISHKNYQYLEEIENKIKDKIKESSQPNLTLDFRMGWDDTVPRMVFKNFKTDPSSKLDFREQFMKFLDELKSIVDIDISIYDWSISRT